MEDKVQSIESLIQYINEFLQKNHGTVKSESFENIIISINKSIDSLKELEVLYEAFTKVDETRIFVENLSENNASVSQEDIRENIDTDYTDFNWQINLNKVNLFSYNHYKITTFFDIQKFQEWLENLNVFNQNNEILKYENLQIVLPTYDDEDIIGNSFIITKKLKGNLSLCDENKLPDDLKIKEFVHLISQESIVFSPKKLAFTLKENTNKFENILETKYAETLLASIVHIFNSREDVTIKGLKHFKIKLNNDLQPNTNIVKILEKAVEWVYEENTSTRLQLLADRLSFHKDNANSLMEIVIEHIEEAFTEAKDRYKFVVTEKSEEYTKDLRDLLKDTKEKTDKYSEKTRTVINSLLRDILGSIFFLGLTAYSRFSGNKDFIFSDDATIIFLLLGSYFLISMLTQAAFNFWDIWLSQKEAHRWSASSMDYMTSQTYNKYVTRPLKTRTVQFITVQIIVIVIYLLLAVSAFNAQKLAKYLNIHNTTQATNSEINTSKKTTSLPKKQNIEDKE
ncbi:hypothetical protein CVO_02470 [Sulfurimonas sp. CVO]|uniref:hypothetical protein n=1 Tax=Sulfurimonas sp. CVO TaxID=2283483 RepID=UPI00132ED4F0|nr:hypothetical protein [Sulfurimonas sp. CVO]QHG90770.1 hypothetical protein CVO_02470 [Sulfurimonas sp. CVO]